MINILISIISIVFISAFLGFLWTGIVSFLILGFCKLTHREEPNISVEALDYIIVSNIILISVISCFIYFNADLEENDKLNAKIEQLENEKEELEKELENSYEKNSSLEEQYEELNSDYEELMTPNDDYDIEEREDGTIILIPNNNILTNEDISN